MTGDGKSGIVRWLHRRGDVIALVLIAVALLRVGSTLTLFSATTDEPVHIAAGLELLMQKQYVLQVENPPMPRLILALPLWLRGVDIDLGQPMHRNLGILFYSEGQYRTNLFLARIGNLLFLLIALLAAWQWTRRDLGPAGACLAVFFLSAQPVVLGYSGIANHDAAATAGLAICLLTFARWFERPVAGRALMAGIAYGVAIGWKFSLIAFVPAACGAAYAVRLLFDRPHRPPWPAIARGLLVIAAAAVVTVWATYGFAFGSLRSFQLDTKTDAGIFAARFIDPTLPLPAPHFVAGVLGIIAFGKIGFWSYALGDWSTTGWWWYFPLALALKTTIASAALALLGIVTTAGNPPVRRGYFVAIAAASAILLIVLRTNLNLGVRYVLPIYVPLAAAAAASALAMLERGRLARYAAVALMAWHGVASVAAHPDYFPYFNEAVRGNPGRYLLDSNLDWGQDVLRLARAARNRKIERLGVSVVGMHDFNALGFPPAYHADPHVPSSGWIAVSEHVYWMYERDGGWRWLQDRPYERVGTSIRLYYIP